MYTKDMPDVLDRRKLSISLPIPIHQAVQQDASIRRMSVTEVLAEIVDARVHSRRLKRSAVAVRASENGGTARPSVMLPTALIERVEEIAKAEGRVVPSGPLFGQAGVTALIAEWVQKHYERA
jgi:hypothetical protein